MIYRVLLIISFALSSCYDTASDPNEVTSPYQVPRKKLPDDSLFDKYQDYNSQRIPIYWEIEYMDLNYSELPSNNLFYSFMKEYVRNNALFFDENDDRVAFHDIFLNDRYVDGTIVNGDSVKAGAIPIKWGETNNISKTPKENVIDLNVDVEFDDMFKVENIEKDAEIDRNSDLKLNLSTIDRNYVEIRFRNMKNVEKMKYKYDLFKIEEVDSTFTINSKELSKLKPGKYILDIRRLQPKFIDLENDNIFFLYLISTQSYTVFIN